MIAQVITPSWWLNMVEPTHLNIKIVKVDHVPKVFGKKNTKYILDPPTKESYRMPQTKKTTPPYKVGPYDRYKWGEISPIKMAL